MANREKKVSLSGKKQSSSPVPPTTTTSELPPSSPSPPPTETTDVDNVAPANEEAPKLTPIKSQKLGRKIKRPVSKKIIKQTLNIPFIPKRKPGRPAKINPLLGNTTKTLEVKKRMKNGVRRGLIKKIKELKPEDDGPPVLEPIFPVEPVKKSRKRVKREDATSDTPEINVKNTKKRRITKKIKMDHVDETIEDVMNDLKLLIRSEELQKEAEEREEMKKKSVAKKPKLDNPQKLMIKKETLENNLNALDSSNSKIIDMLDLNVNKVRKVTKRIRRHSIEKFPMEKNDVTKSQNLTIFSNLPRSISPRAKRGTRQRQSLDILSTKRHNPYSTRSDSPARILRNGKHRKLKDLGLLDGIDQEYRRRRRLCSDYSGSEISISKLSGYESDSSFSDLASLVNSETAERECDSKIEIKKEMLDADNSEQENVNINVISNIPLKIKKSLSIEAPLNGALDENFMDTNSNLCQDSNSELESNTKVINPLYNPNLNKDTHNGNPSLKVPEKSIILDIMKQNFNENLGSPEEDELQSSKENEENITINTSTFYGNTIDESLQSEEPSIELPSQEEDTNEIIHENNNEEKAESVTTSDTNDNSEENITPEKTQESEELMETENLPIQETAKEESEQTFYDTSEDLREKENVLQALGLQSLRKAEEAMQKLKEKVISKNDNYTGTLKTVIKLNRFDKKKGKNSVKMTLQKSKKSSSSSASSKDNQDAKPEEDVYKIMKEVCTLVFS